MVILHWVVDVEQRSKGFNGAYAHDAMAAILVFQNNETVAMLVL